MSTAKSDTISTRISKTLADRIISGAIEAGARLRQDHVAEEFGASHVPVREAFRLLAADEADRDADAVLAWAVRTGLRDGFKQRDAHAAMHGRFTRKERLIAALSRLQANGALRHEKRQNPGARPTDWWAVNPRLFFQ